MNFSEQQITALKKEYGIEDKFTMVYLGRLAEEKREAKREEEKARAKADEKVEDSMLRVVFENIPEDYAG